MHEPEKMTLRQLDRAVPSKDHAIYLRSMDDDTGAHMSELRNIHRAYDGVMAMEVLNLTYLAGKGFVALVGVPVKVIEALDKLSHEE